MDQLGLQFLESRLGLLPFGQVADEAGEEALIAHVHFADGKLHGKGRAVLALADNDTADADDAPLVGAQIAVEVAVMVALVRLRHQHLDVLADDLRGPIVEQPLRRRAEGLYLAAFVDDDHALRDAVEDRLQMRGARFGGVRMRRSRNARPPQHLATP